MPRLPRLQQFQPLPVRLLLLLLPRQLCHHQSGTRYRPPLRQPASQRRVHLSLALTTMRRHRSRGRVYYVMIRSLHKRELKRTTRDEMHN